jgi:DNA helicase-2/ATP-dependent DNA helicase PcrA
MDLSGLNERQREAVLALKGPVLVLAGAGSGKTRVLTMRAAQLIENGVPPWQILAITFTNKAAAEMKQRIEAITDDAGDMWVCTFHAMCAKLLRIESDRLGYTRSFSIYDSGDSLTVVKECLKEINVDKDFLDPRAARSLISKAKNAGVPPEKFRETYGEGDAMKYAAWAYARYESKLKSSNALDFDDLLLKTLDLLGDNPDVLEKYQRRFAYIMVDEYQDTNTVQYNIVRRLARHGNIFVVGDDDQSIYGWRGADIRNILNFERDFPGARVIRLEQNYRSHQGILDAANGVIRHNRGRMGKELWSNTAKGLKPLEFEARSDMEEAQFIAEKAASLIAEGNYRAAEIAVLYRVNSQSRVIENKMKERGVPYVIYGGQSFYERREIKDILAYLNLVCNPSADLCFIRAIGVPRRGVGDVALQKLSAQARERGKPLLLACAETEEILPKKTAAALKGFADMIAEAAAHSGERTVLQTAERLFKASGLKDAMLADDTAEGRMRLLNAEEFFRSITEFEEQTPGPHTLEEFLERNALISEIDAVGDDESAVVLTTLHGAKGLEFPVVFVAGLMEGLLPHQMSMDDGGVEEERRLCYVGMTRAKKRLYLTWSSTRGVRMGDRFDYFPAQRSRFLGEVPEGCIEQAAVKRAPAYRAPEATGRSTVSVHRGGVFTPSARPEKKAEHAPDAYQPGAVVEHPKFGLGKILSTNGAGEEKIAVVRFDTAGEKKMFVAFAPLKIL